MPQNQGFNRSWYVNASSTAMQNEKDVSSEELDMLFCAHFERITRVIGRVVCDQARAEELAVEVFIKWNRNRKIHPLKDGWIYRTAVREALEELRRLKRLSRIEQIFAPFRQPPRTPEQLYTAEIEQANVRAVLAAIDRRQAELLMLWSEELSYREMASACNIQLNYVGSLLSRAQNAFRKEYEKQYGKQS